MGRLNQRLRTRKDLLLAASRLLKSGHKPSMEEIAEEALVSRATAYRYFPSLELLLVEAPLEDLAPTPEGLFGKDLSDDPEARIDKAEAALHKMVVDNEAQLRLMLAYSLSTQADAKGGATPPRQNRRTGLIEAALAPARGEIAPATYERLCASLALVFGIESAVVFRDVLGMTPRSARQVKSWATRALVRAALAESRAEA